MHVLLTGATGVVGQATARALLAEGHKVSAFGKGPDRARVLHAMGVAPVDLDLYDGPRLPHVMRDVDAVLHLATRIPKASQMWKKRAWVDNDRLRTIATGLLVDAALTASTTCFIVHGISFLYPDRGGEWIDEGVAMQAPKAHQSMIDAEAHVARFTAAGRTGIVLRNGLFYGAKCQSVDDALAAAKRGFGTMVGKESGFFSSLHIDDAASATVKALGCPAGIYNVSDDEPVSRRAYVDSFAKAFSFGRLRLPPAWLFGLVGGENGRMLMRSQRVSNRRFREVSGWAPKFKSVKEGWPAVAAARAPSP